MNKVRCRFGIRIPIFRNLGVVVIYLPSSILPQINEALIILRSYSGNDADRIVWEHEPVKPSNPGQFFKWHKV